MDTSPFFKIFPGLELLFHDSDERLVYRHLHDLQTHLRNWLPPWSYKGPFGPLQVVAPVNASCNLLVKPESPSDFAHTITDLSSVASEFIPNLSSTQSDQLITNLDRLYATVSNVPSATLDKDDGDGRTISTLSSTASPLTRRELIQLFNGMMTPRLQLLRQETGSLSRTELSALLEQISVSLRRLTSQVHTCYDTAIGFRDSFMNSLDDLEDGDAQREREFLKIIEAQSELAAKMCDPSQSTQSDLVEYLSTISSMTAKLTAQHNLRCESLRDNLADRGRDSSGVTPIYHSDG